MTDPGTLGAALNDAITQIIAGLPEPTPPKAPTWEDVRRMWEKHRPPYVLACPPGRHADVRDAVGVAGMGHLVEVCATDILEGDDAVLFRRDGNPIPTGEPTP